MIYVNNLKIWILFLSFINSGTLTTYDKDELTFLSGPGMTFKMFKVNIIKVIFYRFQNAHGVCCSSSSTGECMSECTYTFNINCENSNLFQNQNSYYASATESINLNQFIAYADVSNECLLSTMTFVMMSNNLKTFATKDIGPTDIYPGYPLVISSFADISQPNILQITGAFSKVCTPFYGSSCNSLCQVNNTDLMQCDPVNAVVRCRYITKGPGCSQFVSPCDSNPCLNFGVCSSSNAINYVCNCPSGTTGTNCENQVLNTLQCFNKGVMFVNSGCTCVEGSSGENCAVATCLPNYCGKGTCYRLMTNHQCQCDYTNSAGKYCELTCPYTCVNGICLTINGAPQCSCFVGYKGSSCSKPVVELACPVKNLCQNDASCLVDPLTNIYSCICSEEWTGRFCDIPSCNIHNCMNGVCVAGQGCVCVSSYSGATCDKPYCENNACNGKGQCMISILGMEAYCQCNNDYSGPNCDQECYGGCGNFGVCTYSENSEARCQCNEGYTGTNCQYSIKTQQCNLLNCKNGGVCIAKDYKYFCDCPKQWTGETCETFTCDLNNCINGVCIRGIGCVCQDTWSGLSCDVLSCNDGDAFCNNNGFCSVDINIRTCLCNKRHYAGSNCQYECPKYCINGECQLNGNGELACSCYSGFIGDECQHRNLFELYLKIVTAVGIIMIVFAAVTLILTILTVFVFKPEKSLEKATKEDLETLTKPNAQRSSGWETWQV